MHASRRGGVAIQDWSDLLQPRLRGRLAFSDSPREFVGVALKTLGLPFNCSQAQLQASGVTVPQLKERLQQLRQQVTLHRSPCWMPLPPLLLRPAALLVLPISNDKPVTCVGTDILAGQSQPPC